MALATVDLVFDGSSSPQSVTFTPTVPGSLTISAENESGLPIVGGPFTLSFAGQAISTDLTGGQYPLYAAWANLSASGVSAVIQSVPGKRIAVLGYDGTVAGAVSLTWESSGGSVLASTLVMGGAGPFKRRRGRFPYFISVLGEGISVNLSAGVNCGVNLTYALL
jgi:hypothetical protein